MLCQMNPGGDPLLDRNACGKPMLISCFVVLYGISCIAMGKLYILLQLVGNCVGLGRSSELYCSMLSNIRYSKISIERKGDLSRLIGTLFVVTGCH